MEKKKREKKVTNEKPISLHPLSAEEALKVLNIPPPAKGSKKSKSEK